MTFDLIYELDFKRVMSAIINDSRNTIPAIKGQSGGIIYSYIQAQISLVVPGVLVYRIIGNGSNLGGFLALQTQNGVASPLLVQLRPAYQQFSLEISQFIANFITSNSWKSDLLT